MIITLYLPGKIHHIFIQSELWAATAIPGSQ